MTGGASGIGRATARRFAREGADVAVVDVDREGGEETVERLAADGDATGDAAFHELDVSDYEAVVRILEAIAERRGGIDILFNNAGVGEDHTFQETTPAHRDELIDVNLKGVWNGCHAVHPIMRESGGGAIVNTASMAGWRAAPITTYAFTKAAVLHFTRSVAGELARDGVRINAVCPGLVETAMTRKWYTAAEREAMRRQTALDRWAEPAEVAGCVAFLASEDASYITGRDIKVDAGFV